MIGFLRGTLLEKQPPLLLIDVAGVGYEVHAPMTTFYQLPAAGCAITLHTHFVVREDAQQLFGFFDRETRELFRELIKVNGLGPKMALSILSALEVHELVHCIQKNQINTLIRVPGIGRKTAERLLVELRDKAAHWGSTSAVSATSSRSNNMDSTPPTVQDDAEAALIALGYKPQEAEKAIKAILQQCDSPTSEELIRLALKNMLTR